MNRLIFLAITGCLVLALATTSYAVNTRKGKKTYNKICRSCHIRGAHGGKVAPSNKTMSQWKLFIETNQHNAEPEIINKLSVKDRDNLIKFLQDFAKDAAGAASCG